MADERNGSLREVCRLKVFSYLFKFKLIIDLFVLQF